MDTSETYIRMRLAAIPDMGMGKPPSVHNHHIKDDIWVTENGDWYYFTKDSACQLERQDQLQEMITRTDYNLNKFKFLINFVMTSSNNVDILDYSMEQLWLSFAMWEKYQKKWNGSSWCGDVTFKKVNTDE